jgi:hypothetical protein
VGTLQVDEFAFAHALTQDHAQAVLDASGSAIQPRIRRERQTGICPCLRQAMT